MEFCKHGVPRGVCTLGEKDCNLTPPWHELSDEDVTDLLNFWNISDIEIEPFITMVANKVKEKNNG